MFSSKSAIGVAVGVLWLVQPVWAGAGRVMLWGSYPELVLANFFLAILKTYAIRRRYNTPVNTWLVLGATFFSLLFAFVLAASGFTHLVGLDFWGLRSESAWEYRLALLLGLLVAFVVATLVEWPFYYLWLYLRKQHHRLQALHLSLFAQIVSFALILVFYLAISLVR